MTAQTKQQAQLAGESMYARACAVLPGGVNSPVRAFGAVGGTPVFMASGHGPYLTDISGASYVDLVCSWGPMILGHAHPAVTSALSQAIGKGTSFGTATPGEVELAEELVSRTPVQKGRLVSSGSEAPSAALRRALEILPEQIPVVGQRHEGKTTHGNVLPDKQAWGESLAVPLVGADGAKDLFLRR